MFNFKRKPNKYELSELSLLNQMVIQENFKAKLVAGNTALVDDGKKLAKQYEQVGKLINDVKNQKASMLLSGLGYPPNCNFSIDFLTGKITEIIETKNK